MDKPIAEPILDKIRFHKSRIQHHEERVQFHQERIDEWESILAQVQSVQRQEQPAGHMDQFMLALPLPKGKRAANRNVFARHLLVDRWKEGILPVEIRRLANAQGFSCPTNYPYKMLRNLIEQGLAWKDPEGKYHPKKGKWAALKAGAQEVESE
ncbi:MAG: hypothetical protein WBW31_00765 [Candidatus Sulfotelmatobacter sp.]